MYTFTSQVIPTVYIAMIRTGDLGSIKSVRYYTMVNTWDREWKTCFCVLSSKTLVFSSLIFFI